MKAEIIPMGPDTWRIEDGGVRFFLLAGKERVLMMDSGMTVRDARDIAASLTDRAVFLLNTHADMDHTGSNGVFETLYMKRNTGRVEGPTGCSLYRTVIQLILEAGN